MSRKEFARGRRRHSYSICSLTKNYEICGALLCIELLSTEKVFKEEIDFYDVITSI